MTELTTDIPGLVNELQRLAAAMVTVRQTNPGLEVRLPSELVDACRTVLTSAIGSGVCGECGVYYAELPLRRAVMRVCLPGEHVSVQEVRARLATHGVKATGKMVANTLADLGRDGTLQRVAQGQYVRTSPLRHPQAGEGVDTHQDEGDRLRGAIVDGE
ncbi:hypothetical protein [Kibdelosporangium phytohabitans]|uniref:Uncharacterized protein n=1 Tax=Kibdelosporangium phytohabitans TaxID=860235 RepID=A0A0N9HW93_9PSEU|nr:hypothetical protein [Kibdelosporangium phytohabitans]ALG06408.1 hypothetical protein AOZ06_05240 [Kibdelosporangium phytohabitans]MBE1467562.1 hypothetical protein [Kibdelosporangium phytohabitans]